MEAVIGVIDLDAQGSFFRKGRRYWRGPPNAARRESAGSLRSRMSPEPPRLPVASRHAQACRLPVRAGLFAARAYLAISARTFASMRSAHLRASAAWRAVITVLSYSAGFFRFIRKRY